MVKEKSIINEPPSRSRGVLSDLRLFLLHKPRIKTHIKFKSYEERQFYVDRIIQRLGINVEKYSVLNIHQIGINVPTRYTFEELLNWNGDSTCWPNHIAQVSRINGRLENIQIYLLGKTHLWFDLSPLFDLDAIKIQRSPASYDFDNARYLLYKCSGGYPIGIFSMYVRSPVAEQNEVEPTQLFFVVGFNFYGKENLSRISLINRIWEAIHDRVTTNTMVRFKQLCEWRFNKIQEGR